MSKIGRKKGVAFVLHANLRTGAGNERTLINYLNHAPLDEFDITIVQTDHFDSLRIPQETIDELEKKFKIVTVKGYHQKLNFLNRNRPLKMLSTLLVSIMFFLLSLTRYKSVFRELSRNNDIIYLFANEYAQFFDRKQCVIVGSNHNDVTTSLQARLIGSRVLLRNISGFRLFRANENLLKYLGPIDTFVIRKGVDVSKYFPADVIRNDADARFLFVGRLDKSKGLPILLNAWKHLENRKNIELHIVGGGNMEWLVTSVNDNSVKYHGPKDGEELARIYRESDFFVLPTEGEVVPSVILEALSSGLHVITSTALKGVFEEFEKLGYLECIENNENKLSKRMEEVALAVNNYRMSANDIHNRVAENYAIGVEARSLFENLRRIASR